MQPDARSWPDASAYAMAARDAGQFFQGDQLRTATLRKSPLGVPLPATGRNAAVFKATVDDDDLAVRVFTRPPSSGAERYRLIGQHIRAIDGTVFPGVEWCHEAVSVADELWPMLRMEWVEGLTLDEWVRSNLAEPELLRAFAKEWDELFVYLDHSHVAHGDLQHGNVLVDASNAIRLVDLDGLWIPALEALPAPEYGHVHFQHPGRVKDRVWGPRMDGFAALLIGVSISALAHDPSLWERHNDGGNNLIFLADDFEDLSRPIWAELAAIDDERLTSRVDKLRAACGIPCDRLSGPLDMLDDQKTDPAVPGVPLWLQTAMETKDAPAGGSGSASKRGAGIAQRINAAVRALPLSTVVLGVLVVVLAVILLIVALG